eukprot:CAMPEP_0170186890 /NCGR_PEP_ID=MMETSP0040_2-20121228/40394_1 /TAXON_ID=641309 /ORGANISM="Lotharella oceanica, Strain CCMP622" /LENGTH=83 /DNA_ID=CAMNT_0010433771 /DNA_START=337 /DNA_END=585 /DNA_ORIENTATION=-
MACSGRLEYMLITSAGPCEKVLAPAIVEVFSSPSPSGLPRSSSSFVSSETPLSLRRGLDAGLLLMHTSEALIEVVELNDCITQ